jgi:anti-anti-sigma factor
MGMHGGARGAAVTEADQGLRVQTVVLGRRLDGYTVPAVRELLHTAVDVGAGDLVVDLSKVDLVDATGLGVLVGTRRRALRAGRRMVLRGTPPRLRRLLRAARMERLLPTESGGDHAQVRAASGV